METSARYNEEQQKQLEELRSYLLSKLDCINRNRKRVLKKPILDKAEWRNLRKKLWNWILSYLKNKKKKNRKKSTNKNGSSVFRLNYKAIIRK